MTTVNHSETNGLCAESPRSGQYLPPDLRATSVDKVSSLLLSTLIMVASVVCFLGAAFFLSKLSTADREYGPSKGEGASRETLIPRQNLSELSDELDSENWNNVVSEQALDTIQIVSWVEEHFESVSESFDSAVADGGADKKSGEFDQGDGDGEYAIPTGSRWELRFSAKDKKSYAKQLQSLNIELGVYGAGRPFVEYASEFASAKPTFRSGRPADERRPYFLSVSGGLLKEFDSQLLRSAGIEMLGRQPLKFLPAETEAKLLAIEAEYAHAKMGDDFTLGRIVRTVFECRPKTSGDGFEMVVVSQRCKLK